MKRIDFNELPKYSDYLHQILYQSKFRHKNPSEVLREFEDEKWGSLLLKIKRFDQISIEDAIFIELDEDNPKTIIFEKDLNFFLVNTKTAIYRHIDLYDKVIGKYTNDCNGLIELGAGYGSKLIALSKRDCAKNVKLFAGELTRSGCEIINILSDKLNLSISSSQTDFNNFEYKKYDYPNNCVIYTSYALHYLSNMREDLIYNLLSLRPKALIFFEPCYELFEDTSSHGILCKKYFEINDYTKNIYSAIKNISERRSLKLIIKKNVIGINPFLPLSVIEIIPQ